MTKHVILSGCSGGGKSSILSELSSRGFRVVEEPGRRIVVEELRTNGTALPWVDMAAFVSRIIETSLNDIEQLQVSEEWTFFDRGLVDAIIAMEHVKSDLVPRDLLEQHKFYRRVFLVPPWPAVYVQDTERQHSLDEALEEYERLLVAYPDLGYDTVILPKVSVAERTDFVMGELGLS